MTTTTESIMSPEMKPWWLNTNRLFIKETVFIQSSRSWNRNPWSIYKNNNSKNTNLLLSLSHLRSWDLNLFSSLILNVKLLNFLSFSELKVWEVWICHTVTVRPSCPALSVCLSVDHRLDWSIGFSVSKTVDKDIQFTEEDRNKTTLTFLESENLEMIS